METQRPDTCNGGWRFDSLDDIDHVLEALENDVRRQLAADGNSAAWRPLLVWLQDHRAHFASLATELAATPGAAELVSDWLRHHAPPSLPAARAGRSALLSRADAIDISLRELIASLLQHSDAVWACELYRYLLDHERNNRSH